MQVKKYEAKSMQDALKMIKMELGPEAIILQAKNLSKGFGLMNQGSVEVTAAVSEGVLKKKQLVESRMRAVDKERFSAIPARRQKEMIEKVVGRYSNNNNKNANITAKPYISISDDEAGEATHSREQLIDEVINKSLKQVKQAETQVNRDEDARKRVQNAAKTALDAGRDLFADEQKTAAPKGTAPKGAQASSSQVTSSSSDVEVHQLKQEIARLQSVIQGFQKMPQTFVTAHPGAQFGIPYELNPVFEKLSQAGVSTECVVEIIKAAQATMPGDQLVKTPMVDAFAARYILDHVATTDKPLESKFHSFIGPSGGGKTSSLVKMASYLVIKKKKKIAILSSDIFKVGAVDQLKIYCKILNIPCFVMRPGEDNSDLINQLHGCDHVLIDHPGMSMSSIEEIDFTKGSLLPGITDHKVHLVLSCSFKEQDCIELAQRFKVAKFNDIIFTGLDLSRQHGLIYSVQQKTGCPLHSFGTGSRVPEDFEFATKERVLDLIFKLSSLKGQRG